MAGLGASAHLARIATLTAPDCHEDLKELFGGINKEYSKSLYDMQFALYVDKIVARIDLQTEAYGKEENLPGKLFEVYEEQKKGLLGLKEKFGAVVTVDDLG